MMKYPLELRLEVLKAYQDHVGGYKKLAKLYGLNREIVRYWILDRRRKQPLKIDELIQTMAGITMAGKSKDPAFKTELHELQLQLAYYKKLSAILEAENKDEKKKHAVERFKNSHQKDIQ
jgi:transposase-like protein